MSTPSCSPANARLGIHYYPDTQHYREKDLAVWLPELGRLGVSWLTLQAPQDRAIPENFVTGLLSAGIQPLLHFHFPLPDYPASDCKMVAADLRLLFETYARWGITYAVLFDRPNLRRRWSPMAWAQSQLVERFLDLFLPIAEAALQAGLLPVFPPLEPGGDYWDTAFLRAALQGLQRRGHHRLLEQLVLGAYARLGQHPLDWGAGGPERWPQARPYLTSSDCQDHRGFRIFDWYLALSQAVLGEPRPVLLIASDQSLVATASQPQELETHAQTILSIARLMAGEITTEEPVSPLVLACNHWLLTAAAGHPAAAPAWFQPGRPPLPCVHLLQQWTANQTHPCQIDGDGTSIATNWQTAKSTGNCSSSTTGAK
jgi:hypothetical protein